MQVPNFYFWNQTTDLSWKRKSTESTSYCTYTFLSSRFTYYIVLPVLWLNMTGTYYCLRPFWTTRFKQVLRRASQHLPSGSDCRFLTKGELSQSAPNSGRWVWPLVILVPCSARSATTHKPDIELRQKRQVPAPSSACTVLIPQYYFVRYQSQINIRLFVTSMDNLIHNSRSGM